MATLSYSPTAPVFGEEVTLSLVTTSPYEIGRFYLTSVPSASSLSTGPLVDQSGAPVATFTPDTEGAYGVTGYVYRRFVGGAAYPGDPAGEAREELVSTCTGTIYVGRREKLTIRALGHAVDLRWAVVGATVTDATLVRPTTERARLAALDTTVLAALAAMDGVDVGLVGEDLQADVKSLVGKYNDHRDKTSDWHLAIDSTNVATVKRIDSNAGAIDALSVLYDHMVNHMNNIGGVYHSTADRSNIPIVTKASDRASATVLLADLRRRVYSRHIATTGSPTVHFPNPDDDNLISADSPLSAAIVAVLDYFAAQTPATPPGEGPGAPGASEYGFVPDV